MATSLINTTPQATYTSLLKLGDNSALSATLKRISDGAGNDTPIEISTAAVQFGGSTGMYWDNTNRRLGIGTTTPLHGLHVTGGNSIRLSNIVIGVLGNNVISTPPSDTSINVNNGVGISGGTVLTPSARLHVRGSGATSATTALLVENSAGTAALTVRDDRQVIAAAGVTVAGTLGLGSGLMEVGPSLNMRFVASGATRTFLFNHDYTNTPNASAIAEFQSTTQGILPPKMTTTQKNAIASPAAGLVVYDTDTNKLCCYNGTTWNDLF